jgi:hypothetical protein
VNVFPVPAVAIVGGLADDGRVEFQTPDGNSAGLDNGVVDGSGGLVVGSACGVAAAAWVF